MKRITFKNPEFEGGDEAMYQYFINQVAIKVYELENELYVLDFSGKTTTDPMCLFGKADAGWLWHRQIGRAHV